MKQLEQSAAVLQHSPQNQQNQDEVLENIGKGACEGGTKKINVSMDSGTAMIRDIVNHLGC